MTDKTNHLRDYHAPVWDEPVVMQLGYPGRRGQVFPQPASDTVGAASTLFGENSWPCTPSTRSGTAKWMPITTGTQL